MIRSVSILGFLALWLGGALPAHPTQPLSAQATMTDASTSGSDTRPVTAVYTLRIPEPSTHLVEVEARFTPPRNVYASGGALELMMAVWTPGSYLVREYARNVEAVRAETDDGSPVPVTKVSKNRWRLDAEGEAVTVRYRLYCRELTVRTNFVDPELALLNGAGTYLVPAGGAGAAGEGPAPGPYRVQLELPPDWKRTATALDPLGEQSAGETTTHAYTAPDYATLVDSPIYAGNGRLYEFEIEGVPHRVLAHGESGPWEGEKAVSDIAKIVRAERAFWGELPYPEFLFINLIVEAGGGLEHAESTVLMTSRWKMGTRKGYLSWLGLVAHELFHAWNVKRLRPVELVSFDYEREVYSRNLWIAEGITSYYDDLMVHRAGLSTREEALEALSRQIERLQTTPGRRVQPVELASFDAWIKLYRPDENTINSAVSYYTKGAVIAFLLDATIRRYSDGERSLDDAMRLAWQRFAVPLEGRPPSHPSGAPGAAATEGFTGPAMREIFAEVAGRSVDPLLDRMLRSTREIDYSPALEWYGLRFAAPENDDEPRDEHPAWTGAETEVLDGRLVVTRVPRGTPAYEAGLQVEDELLAIAGFRVPPRELEERLKAFRPDQRSTLLVARRERLVEVAITFGREPVETWKLEVDPDATPEQRRRLDDWLEAASDPPPDRDPESEPERNPE